MKRYGMSGLVLGAEIFVLIVVIFLSAVGVVFGTRRQSDDVVSVGSESQTDPWASENGSEEQPSETTSEPEYSIGDRLEFSNDVEMLIASMTLEEKVAQIFMVTPEALADVKAATKAGAATQKAINAYPVGGLCYDSRNFQNKQQVSQLLAKTQEYSVTRSGIQLFMAVEEEGGNAHSPLGTALGNPLGASASELKGKDAAAASQAAGTIAAYIKDVGFNMNLAPVANCAAGADADYDDRTFGSDPAAVSPLISAQTAAYKNNGILTVLKRYPGEGDATGNAGITAFKEGVSAGADCIMLSNISSPELTGTATVPCSLSENVVCKLRGELGFEGILMTDSFSDPEIARRYKPGQAAIMAIQAGVDMIYLPADFQEAYQDVVAAFNENEIPIELLDNAVGRILTVKEEAGMLGAEE